MRYVLLTVVSAVFLFCKGQTVYVPYNIREAYKKKTRNILGVPGKKYFQNKAEYKIRAEFDPVKGILSGNETVVYYNNSPDSLSYFVIRLYHDILKKGALRDEEIPEEYLTDGVKLNSFKINNYEYIGKSNFYFERKGTNLFAGTDYFILPGDTVIFNIEWQTNLPQGSVHRFGMYERGNWFVSYWYPQIAVYDDIDGWDTYDYTGLYEFYNDMSDYEVEITLPSDYLMWATGNWNNAEEILLPKIYERYQQAKESNELVRIVSSDDWKKKQVLVKKKKLKYSFTANNVTDFAFAVSNNYSWNAATTFADTNKENRTTIQAVFPEGAKNFKDLALVGAKCINHFVTTSLQVSFPYNNTTIFCGAGGMEYPMMVNMGDEGYSQNVFTAMHEIFHAYFPFYTGMNERKYAWLDEGLCSYLPIETEAYLNKELTFPLSTHLEIYNSYSGKDTESPLFTPSAQTRGRNYYNQAYFRSSAAFSVLEEYVGRERFRAAIREFINIWAYKHPTGYDFIFGLNNFLEEDLIWLIEPWFFGMGWADLAIEEVNITKTGYEIYIRNEGGLPVPVNLKVIPQEGDSYFIRKQADVWKGKELLYIHVSGKSELKRLEIGDLNVPDKVSNNNYYYFKKPNK